MRTVLLGASPDSTTTELLGSHTRDSLHTPPIRDRSFDYVATLSMLHLGYEVWVEDEGGRRIPEYKVQTEGEDGTTIAAYIPSESGKVCSL